MCRYAFQTYKKPFACFKCRKSFKKLPLEDYLRQQGMTAALTLIQTSSLKLRKRMEAELGLRYEDIRDEYLAAVATCPDCGDATSPMGLDFKAPAQDDVEAWKIVQALYEHGFSFQGCGCYVGYSPPEKLRDLPSWLERHERRSAGSALLAAILDKPR